MIKSVGQNVSLLHDGKSVKSQTPIPQTNENIFPVKQDNSIVDFENFAKEKNTKTNDNNTKKSFWQKIKSLCKNNSNIMTLSGMSFGCVGAGLLLKALGFTGFSSLGVIAIGIILGAITVEVIVDEFKKEKNDKINAKVLSDLKEEKTKEQSSNKLDKTLQASSSIGSEFAAFKTKNGIMAEKVNVPLALKMNKILEKYSTDNNPEINEQEQQELQKDLKEFFAEYIHLANNNQYYDSPYRYNQPSGYAVNQRISENICYINKLINDVTSENSSSGKSIDVSELVQIREKMFSKLNQAK